MKILTLLLLINLIFAPKVFAEDIQVLQQRANFAYDQMMKAKREAEILSDDVTATEKRQQRIEQELIRTKEAVAIAKQKSKESNLLFDQAVLRWKESSDALSQEWGKSKR